jgi:hypothetical protein
VSYFSVEGNNPRGQQTSSLYDENTDRRMACFNWSIKVHAEINLVATMLRSDGKVLLHGLELFWTLILLAGSLTLGRTLTSSLAYISRTATAKALALAIPVNLNHIANHDNPSPQQKLLLKKCWIFRLSHKNGGTIRTNNLFGVFV